MPPVNQGSRGGLITAVVIFTILFVTATIFAIIYSVEARRMTEEHQTLQERYNEIVEQTEVEGTLVQDLKAMRANSKYPGVTEGMPVINVAVQQRDTLARRIAGSGATAAGVLDAADAALKAAADRIKETGLAVPTDSLTNAVTAMSNAVQNLHQQNEQLKQQLQQKLQQNKLSEFSILKAFLNRDAFFIFTETSVYACFLRKINGYQKSRRDSFHEKIPDRWPGEYRA